MTTVTTLTVLSKTVVLYTSRPDIFWLLVGEGKGRGEGGEGRVCKLLVKSFHGEISH